MSEKDKGFTLVELAIVLLISGLIIATAAQCYMNYQTDHKRQATIDAVTAVRAAMDEFRGNNGRYPCPASFDSNDGKENCTVFAANKVRSVLGGGGQPVLIGSVPYKTMADPDDNPATGPENDGGLRYAKLPRAQTRDAYGARLVYAVTAGLTVPPGSYVPLPPDPNLKGPPAALTLRQRGAIEIRDEHDQTVLDKAGTAHLAIFSLGPDNRGAYSDLGIAMEPCLIPAPPPGTLNETTNCLMNGGTFLAGLYNTNGLSYNDDILTFTSTKNSALWAMVDKTRAHNTNAGFVGVGVNNPSQQLEVQGNLRAATVRTTNLCDTGGQDCMPPSTLGGQEPGMRCPPGEVAQAIEQNKVYACHDPFGWIRGHECPTGFVLVGISSFGSLICDPHP